jgi:hypothetical protein
MGFSFVLEQVHHFTERRGVDTKGPHPGKMECLPLAIGTMCSPLLDRSSTPSAKAALDGLDGIEAIMADKTLLMREFLFTERTEGRKEEIRK